MSFTRHGSPRVSSLSLCSLIFFVLDLWCVVQLPGVLFSVFLSVFEGVVWCARGAMWTSRSCVGGSVLAACVHFDRQPRDASLSPLSTSSVSSCTSFFPSLARSLLLCFPCSMLHFFFFLAGVCVCVCASPRLPCDPSSRAHLRLLVVMRVCASFFPFEQPTWRLRGLCSIAAHTSSGRCRSQTASSLSFSLFWLSVFHSCSYV